MEYIKAFWDSCGMGILCTILTAIASYLGVCAKKLFQKYFDDKTKKAVAKTCVEAIEQLYKDLHGQEKYDKAAEAIVEMLNEKGITITDLELKMLIEATVNKFNEAFRKDYGFDTDDNTTIEGFKDSAKEEQ